MVREAAIFFLFRSFMLSGEIPADAFANWLTFNGECILLGQDSGYMHAARSYGCARVCVRKIINNHEM